MKTMRLIAAGVLAGLATTAFGKTWYVNCRAANASDANPGTETEPFKTINAASTNVAFTAGDTILVAPGVYNEGWARPTYSGNVTTNRVYLPKKTILRASGPRDETFIVGKLHGGKLGFSTANIRCILVDGRESVIEGFTICNGGTAIV